MFDPDTGKALVVIEVPSCAGVHQGLVLSMDCLILASSDGRIRWLSLTDHCAVQHALIPNE